MQSRPWRLILDTAHGAAENMAIDEAIMRSCAESASPPTLRIYSWRRPSISLGCMQRILRQADGVVSCSIDLDFCRSEGIEVVRRITGGRAVIHGADVTFSVALRESDLPDGCSSVLASHRWLMSGIVRGLRLLGIDAEVGLCSGGSPCPPQRADTAALPPDCFDHVAQCDIRVARSKVVGSAQVRRFGALLEQGSIPYGAPALDADRVFGRERCGKQHHPLEGQRHSCIAEAVSSGFGSLCGHTLEPRNLTQLELETATRLATEVYSTEEWTLHGSTACY